MPDHRRQPRVAEAGGEHDALACQAAARRVQREAAGMRLDRRTPCVGEPHAPPVATPRAARAAAAAGCSRRRARSTCRRRRRGRCPAARRHRRAIEHVDVAAFECRVARPAARIRRARASSSRRRQAHVQRRPAGAARRRCRSRRAVARRGAATRAPSAASTRRKRGMPSPLPCTQIRPKLPRAARCATSPSSSTREPAAEVAQAERDRRADQAAADDDDVEVPGHHRVSATPAKRRIGGSCSANSVNEWSPPPRTYCHAPP